MADAPERYGRTKVSKIMAAYNDLRAAVRSGDIIAANTALDRYEQWAGFALGHLATRETTND